jgi:hypothetical protein
VSGVLVCEHGLRWKLAGWMLHAAETGCQTPIPAPSAGTRGGAMSGWEDLRREVEALPFEPGIIAGRATWVVDRTAVLAANYARAALSGSSTAPLDRLVEKHTPWARCEFIEERLWLACYCGWNADNTEEGGWNAHFLAAASPDPAP